MEGWEEDEEEGKRAGLFVLHSPAKLQPYSWSVLSPTYTERSVRSDIDNNPETSYVEHQCQEHFSMNNLTANAMYVPGYM
jgi:hypothetical protein